MPTFPGGSLLPLTYTSDFSTNSFLPQPEALIFDADAGELVIGTGPSMFRIETDGTVVSSAELCPGESCIEGFALRPDNGNLLVINDGSPTRIREFTLAGVPVTDAGAIDLSIDDFSNAEGIVVHPTRDTIFIADDDGFLAEIEFDGTIINQVASADLLGGFAQPSGITVDASTGNLIVVSDNGVSGGMIAELRPDFTLLDRQLIMDLTVSIGGGLSDADGVSIDPDTRDVYIAIEAGSRIVRAAASGTVTPRCAQPLSSGDQPTASDCLFILRAAVGLDTCTIECQCLPTGTTPITATDALLCLRSAVGGSATLNCPCS